jgi:hypothetical protein
VSASLFARYALPYDDHIAFTHPVFTGSAEDSDYPASNWNDNNPAKPGKLTTTSGWWEFDMLAAVPVAAFALVYHNLSSGLSGVSLQANSSSSWGSPPVDLSITIPAWTEDGWSVSPWIAVNETYRFWRLNVSGTNAYPLSVGRPVFLSALRDFGRDVRWGSAIEEVDQPIIEMATEGGANNIANIFSPQRTLSGEFDLIDSELSQFSTLYRAVANRAKPWLLIPDASGAEAWMVRFADTKRSRTLDTINHHVLPFRVQELSRGLPWP